MSYYCEICGRAINDTRQARKAFVDGIPMIVCSQCYEKLARQGRAKPFTETRSPEQRTVKKAEQVKTSVSSRLLETMYEIVEDYAERVKRAREKLGWSQAILAQKLRVSENVIKRIEAGKLKPSIELARRMEKILGVTLLEPVAEEYSSLSTGREEYLTIGDIIKVSENRKRD